MRQDEARGEFVAPADGLAAGRIEGFLGFRFGEYRHAARFGDQGNEVGWVALTGTDNIKDRGDREFCGAPGHLPVQAAGEGAATMPAIDHGRLGHHRGDARIAPVHFVGPVQVGRTPHTA